MAWNEWEQLKAGARAAGEEAGRSGGVGAGTGAGSEAGTGAGSGAGAGAGTRADLVAHQNDLGAVGHEAYVLHGALLQQADIAGAGAREPRIRTGPPGTRSGSGIPPGSSLPPGSGVCASSQAAAALSSHHFAMGAALATTVSLWSSQLDALLQACAHISDHLDHTKASHARDDARIRTRIRGVTSPEAPVSRLSGYFK